jgi:small subunit ribosomal protein S16
MMAVKIRLRRMGSKKRPFYRVVVADSRRARDGRFIENLGYYNPCVEPADLKINDERARHWLQCGAQPSDTAAALLKKQGIIGRTVVPTTAETTTAETTTAETTPAETATPAA